MASNVLNRYLFEDLSVRGELVQLDSAYQSIIANKNYPVPLQGLLGELLVATTLLTATLKFEGSITLQLQGDGPVSLAVINGDHEQKVRGVARFDGNIDDEASIHDMLGKGHLVITIDPKQGGAIKESWHWMVIISQRLSKATLQTPNNYGHDYGCELGKTIQAIRKRPECYCKFCLMLTTQRNISTI